ncbi:Uma2 family endonuclease [Sorangium sp. So ce861]|uniref:Uma2 family endonuclease n=1 Tax=Sorangium sp. So ce861 TaxID=3133323 RepID=UPI003F5F2328
MSVTGSTVRPLQPERATLADWLAEPDDRGAELIRGRLVYKAVPSPEHGRAQRKLGALLDAFDGRPGEGGRPGGWWLSTEVDVELFGEGVRPDLAGWRRDRVPALPKAPPGGAVTERPDWVAEVLSSSTAARDLGDKRSIYHAAGVGHYWVLDPANRLLIVYRWAREGYLFALSAGAGEPVRAEPFEALELRVELLFGDEGEPEAAAPRP